jgi:eukaryotic-like serine/threonine-protein kinase
VSSNGDPLDPGGAPRAAPRQDDSDTRVAPAASSRPRGAANIAPLPAFVMDEFTTEVEAKLPPSQPEPAMVSSPAAVPSEPKTRAHERGSSLGRYIVLDLLGRGGVGAVYATYDPQLDRRVAVKLLHTASADDKERKRLVREARALAKLSHPNVVHVYDAGVHEGDVFVAMELIEGKSFREWVTSEPRPSYPDILRAYLDAARGLLAAHDRGLVHRDIKPANILMGKDGRVRVADFGLAIAHEPADDDGARAAARRSRTSATGASRPSFNLHGQLDDRLTMTGTILGTPAYMAPEQYDIDAKVGPLADQYSLCISLYEALYAALPFVYDESEESLPRLLRLMQDKRDGALKTPPADSPVPAWVFEVLRRGLSPRPEDRYPSLAALIRALTDDPLSRRRTRLRALGMAIGVLLLAGVAIAGWIRSGLFRDPCAETQGELAGVWDAEVKRKVQAALLGTGRSYALSTVERVTAALDRYAGDWGAMRTDVCRASRKAAGSPRSSLLELRDTCLVRRRGQLRALTEVLAAGPDPQVLDKAVQAVQGLYPMAYCADEKALTARLPPPEDPALRAHVEALIPRVDRLEALYRASKSKVGLAEGEALLAEMVNAEHAPVRAQAMYWMGLLRMESGDYDSARWLLRETLFHASRGKDDALATKALAVRLYILASKQKRFDEAQALIDWAPFFVERTDDDQAIAHWLNNLAEALFNMSKRNMSKLEEAKVLHERALAIKEKALGPNHSSFATSLNNLANVLAAMGKLEEAKAMHERALYTREKILGPDHPDVAQSLNNLANQLLTMGRYEEAKAVDERALAIREKAFGPDHPEVALSLNNMGDLLNLMGRYEEAKPLLERSLAIMEKELGPSHPDVAMALDNLGSVLYATGRYEEARPLYERALPIWEKAMGPDHPLVSEALTGMGRALVQRGDFAAAARSLQRALAIREKALGKSHADLAPVLLGQGELALARRAPAVPVLERAFALDAPDFHVDIGLALSQALWAAGTDKPRAIRLATEAREQAERAGQKPIVAKATRWLAQHRLQPARR